MRSVSISDCTCRIWAWKAFRMLNKVRLLARRGLILERGLLASMKSPWQRCEYLPPVLPVPVFAVGLEMPVDNSNSHRTLPCHRSPYIPPVLRRCCLIPPSSSPFHICSRAAWFSHLVRSSFLAPPLRTCTDHLEHTAAGLPSHSWSFVVLRS